MFSRDRGISGANSELKRLIDMEDCKIELGEGTRLKARHDCGVLGVRRLAEQTSVSERHCSMESVYLAACRGEFI